MRIATFTTCASVVALKLSLVIALMMVPLAVLRADENPQPRQVVSKMAVTDSQPHHIKINKLAGYIQKKYKVTEHKAASIVTEAIRNAEKYDGLEPELILAVIAVESTFKERAVGQQGSRGLMQVLPKAHPGKVKAIGGVHQLFDPGKNILTGSRILASYVEDSNGNLKRALLRYNGGDGSGSRSYAEKVMRIYWDMRRQTTVG